MKNRLIITILFIFLLLDSDCSTAGYLIRIDKSDNSLLILNKGKTIKTYKVAIGRGGKGDKKQRGDKKTPTGNYFVTGFNENSKFDFFIRLNYPNIKDAYYGYRRRLISQQEFKTIVEAVRNSNPPPQNTKLGGAIGIHGIGQETPRKLLIHRNIDWTDGCIALRNFEAVELKNFIKIGTRVIISE